MNNANIILDEKMLRAYLNVVFKIFRKGNHFGYTPNKISFEDKKYILIFTKHLHPNNE